MRELVELEEEVVRFDREMDEAIARLTGLSSFPHWLNTSGDRKDFSLAAEAVFPQQTANCFRRFAGIVRIV